MVRLRPEPKPPKLSTPPQDPATAVAAPPSPTTPVAGKSSPKVIKSPILPENRERLLNKDWRLTHFYAITNKDKKLVWFKLNKMQEHFHKNKTTRNIILKSRQLGATTFASIDMLDDVLFNKNFDALLISYDQESAYDIFDNKVMLAWKNFDLAPFYELDTERQNKFRVGFKENKDGSSRSYSSLSVKATGRSGTFQRAHVCLHPDTEIMMKNGYVKRIKDIYIGDEVMTGDGTYQRVSRLVKNKRTDIAEDMFEIQAFGFPDPLRITGNHEILVRGKNRRKNFGGGLIWKQAKEVTIGEYLSFPVRKYSNKRRNKFLTLSDGSQTPEVNFDLGYFTGLFLAEGSLLPHKYFLRKKKEWKIYKNRFTISCHQKEIPEIVEFLKKFSSHFSRITARKSKNSLTGMVEIGSPLLYKFLEEYFIDPQTKDKYIPDSVWNYGRPFMDGLLRGYFAGDGYLKNETFVQVDSARRQLVDQVKKLCITLRFGFPALYRQKAGMHYGRNCKEQWTLRLMGDANRKFRKHFGLPTSASQKKDVRYWRPGKNHFFSQITSIKKMDAKDEPEFVYDIVLEKDPHNFTTVHGVVHNSEFAKICRKFPEKAKEIITGTFPSVPLHGRIDIESTAEGEDSIFADMFWEAWNRPTSQSRKPTEFQAFFYNWQWDERAISKILHVDSQLPKEFKEYQQKHNEKAKNQPTLYQPINDIQLTYWFYKWIQLGKDWNKLFQEEPTTPDEAFRSSGQKLFDQIKIEQLLATTKEPRSQGDWLIYEEPIRNHSYALGVDPAEGVGADSSAATLIDFSLKTPKVVATYANPHIAPDMLAYEIRFICLLYNMPLVAVERNNTGFATLTKLRDIYPEDQIFKEIRDDKEDEKETHRYGWHTNLSTKPRMFYDLKTAVNDDALDIPSKPIVNEMRTYDRSGLGELRANENQTRHWDILTALAIAYQMRSQLMGNNDTATVVSVSSLSGHDKYAVI